MTLHPNAMTVRQLAETLEELRLDNGWSYPRLGAESGIPFSTLYRFVNDRNTAPYATTVHAIRKFLASRLAEKSPVVTRQAASR